MKGGESIKISYSKFSTYLRCPYAHYLGYVEGLKAKRPVRPLHFGSDFHKLLEVKQDPERIKAELKAIKEKYYAIPPAWQSDLGENYVQDIRTIFKDYMKMWKDTPVPKITEHPFELEIGKYHGEPIVFNGVIDELYKYKERESRERYIKLGEHKTFSRPPDMNTLVMNTQKSLYSKAVQIIWGQLPRTVIWDYIRSVPAKEPVWLESSKRFSAAKSKEITRASWRRACKAKGIDDPKVLAQGDIYKGNEHNFFFRVEQDIYPEMVDRVWDGFRYTALEIAKNGERNKTQNVTRDCNWCNFRDICMAEMSGGNRRYVIEKNFTTREQREAEEKEEEVTNVSD